MPVREVRARAVILTVSGAKASGVVLSEPDFDKRGACRGYVSDTFGVAKTPKQREAWATEAWELAQALDLPLVVVFSEDPFSYGLSSTSWLTALRRVGINIRMSWLREKPQTWQAKVFGKPRSRTLKGLKVSAVRYAEEKLKMGPDLQENIAEAACIRVWAERAPEVHALLTRQKKAA